MYKEIQIAAWRTYQYYLKIKGDWDGLFSWQLLKMKKSKFLDLLKGREEIERKILLTFLTLNQSYMTEDHINGYMWSKIIMGRKIMLMDNMWLETLHQKIMSIDDMWLELLLQKIIVIDINYVTSTTVTQQ